ncbi:hypothetical protein [Dapis sp. BLCC M229]
MAQVYTAKLNKYLVGAIRESPLQSLITFTDDGAAGNSHRRNYF